MSANRFARPENFADRVRNPLLREHFVYRAFDETDLLYVGCSYTVEARMKAHRSTGDWYSQMVRLRLAGPYNFETARQLERDAIRTERPLFNSMTPERCAVRAAHDRILKRCQNHLMSEGMEFWPAFHAAMTHADHVLFNPPNREAFYADDLTIASALRADREDASTYGRRSA